MKVITECTISMRTLQTIREKSYEYVGPVAECKGGGGGSSGSGAIDYPAYMEAVHADWLDNTGADNIASSITDVMNTALGNSPWVGQVAYDPDADITAMEAAMTTFAAILAGIIDTTDWAALYTQAAASIDGVSEAVIAADVAAFADQIDDEITTKVLPRFRAGMRDINAVVSSAFVIGESVIEGFRDREVAKHSSGIRLTLKSKDAEARIDATGQMLQLMLQRISWQDGYMRTTIEQKRIKIVAKDEENETAMKIDEYDAMWDMEVFQHGSNVLAAIAGGIGHHQKQPSKMQSALGGAMSGAALGAMIAGGAKGGMTGPEGAAVGAGVGLAAYLLMS